MNTNQYIIGSHAIKAMYPSFPREPKDVDYLVRNESVEIEGIAERSERHIIPVLFEYLVIHGISGSVMLTLKASHIFWDIRWEKHMYDIVFLFEHGAKMIPDLFSALYHHWCSFHGQNKRSELNMTAADFFDNALKGEYDHDYLHTLINPSPMYLKVLKDGAEVDVSEEKFNLLSHVEKLELVREEVYVMAFERLAGRSYRAAYSWMLKKFIMNHAPMWEALFILKNFRALHKPIINYKTKIEDAIKVNV